MYVSLEGVKGSGKTTILTLLIQAFQKSGVPFAVVAPTRPVISQRPVIERLATNFQFLRHYDRFNEALYAARSNYVAQHTDWNIPLLIGDRSIVTSYVSRWRKWENNPQLCIRRVDLPPIEWTVS